jgi:hypothetical protein
MNECVVLRSAPDRVVLYYTADALADASVGRIRAATRCLFNNCPRRLGAVERS